MDVNIIWLIPFLKQETTHYKVGNKSFDKLMVFNHVVIVLSYLLRLRTPWKPTYLHINNNLNKKQRKSSIELASSVLHISYLVRQKLDNKSLFPPHVVNGC